MTPPKGTARRTPARQSRPNAAAVKESPRPDAGTLSYAGEEYKLAKELGMWPLLQFARASEAGWRTDDPRGLAALHAFLEDVIDAEDWGRFQEDMLKSKITDIFGLMTAAQQAVNAMLDARAANGELDGKEEEAEPEDEAADDATARPPRELKA